MNPSKPAIRNTVLHLIVFLQLAPAVGLTADPHQEAIDRAIDRGVEYLMKCVHAQQSGKHQFGQVALETYALVVAGVSVNHPLIANNFSFLHKRLKGSTHTYSLACYIFALDAAIAQLESDLLILNPQKAAKGFKDNPSIGRQLRPYLHSAVKALVKTQNAHGAWRYFQNTDFDNSNTQFAVLGLGVGAKRGVRIDSSVWKGIMNHFVKGQQKNGPGIGERLTLMTPKERGERSEKVELVRKSGSSRSKSRRTPRGRTEVRKRVPRDDPIIGTESLSVKQRGWDYENKGGATWNMTCAGLSSLLLARENLRGDLDNKQWKDLEQAVWDGYGWVMGNWNPMETYYGLYSLEKVADIGGVKKFGNRDWYREVSADLVKRQGGDGSWKGTGKHGEDDRVATSFALLVLRRATTLLTMNPASRIIVSGRSSSLDPEDRSWVYIAKLDTCLHYPSLLKVLRKRPNPKLAKFLKTIVESYPEEWKGDLVPELVRTREALSRKSLKRALDGYLEDITGTRSEDPREYLEWHKKWKRVHAIAKAGNKKDIPELLNLYQNDMESVPFKQTVIWALIRLKVRKAIPILFRDLQHEEAKVRLSAYNALKTFYLDTPPPFDPGGSQTRRASQVEAIKGWIRTQERKLKGG